MKLQNILEAIPHDDGLGGENPDVPKEWFDWIEKHKATVGNIRPRAWSVKNGELCCLKTRVLELKGVTDEDLPPFKLGEMGHVICNQYCSFSDLSWLPTSVDTLSFETASVKSIKGLSKKCKYVDKLILSPLIKSGLLEVFRLNGLKTLSSFFLSTGRTGSDYERAYEIVSKGFEAKADALDVQSELLDTGLGRFA